MTDRTTEEEGEELVLHVFWDGEGGKGEGGEVREEGGEHGWDGEGRGRGGVEGERWREWEWRESGEVRAGADPGGNGGGVGLSLVLCFFLRSPSFLHLFNSTVPCDRRIFDSRSKSTLDLPAEQSKPSPCPRILVFCPSPHQVYIPSSYFSLFLHAPPVLSFNLCFI